ncbi:hypothetical protein J2Z21_006124 [Streptomyces griseochromogenes]|uniref:Uncharacterized protein n=1 Tax=Streptomyces griseochromogenes TaxID=68214 RepID=A0ABS4M0E8_9ACTN|nr:hypothetical protein [Streptomyces griseochromogenes]MBP2053133.1 hypothetical protein [Streptomyces griseochromogenes]
MLAGSATAMGANPAAAAGKPHPVLVDRPQKPPAVIAPGHSGRALIRLENTGRANSANNGRMYMEIWAPYGTRFTDTKLTPLHGAPGGWSCKGDAYRPGVPYESTVLRCVSDHHGPVVRAGRTAVWQLRMKVEPGTRAGTTLSATPNNYGAALHYSYHGKSVWKTLSLAVRTPGGQVNRAGGPAHHQRHGGSPGHHRTTARKGHIR